MAPETLTAMRHNIFTPGNYFYNGIGHFTVKYEEVLEIGFAGHPRPRGGSARGMRPRRPRLRLPRQFP